MLSTSVKNFLLDRILRGYYKPGDRIVEFQLCKELGTSQSPVREAVRELASIHSRRGARVRRPTTKELVDNNLVRSEIDALAAGLATPLLDEATLVALRETCEDMEHHQASDDYSQLTQADAHFHRLIVQASANQALLQTFDRLEPFARTFITLTIPTVNVKSVVAEHRLILEALEARDPSRAAMRARNHQLSVGELLNTHYDPGSE